MNEQKILSAVLKSREVWEKIKDKVEKDEWSPEGKIIFELCSSFYQRDPGATVCDAEILSTRAIREIQSAKVAEIVSTGIRSLSSGLSDISAENVAEEVIALKRSVLGIKIAAALSTGKDPGRVLSLMDEYKDLGTGLEEEKNSEELFSGVSALDISRRSFNRDNLIKLEPKILNDHIDGGLRGGHHVLIFAPTEMGKSLVAINLCYGFLKQNLKVLYCGNEDPAPDMMMRMMSRLTGMNKYEILENPERADEILKHRNWDKFILANMSPGTFRAIHKLLDELKPQVLVLDQLRNIDVESDNRTQALEKAATEARNTAKKYNIPVISVTQAADSASGKKVLNRGDVDSSNIGIPGQTDLMIGIGATPDMEEQNLRMFSFCKNKLSGRHSPIPIQVDPLLSKVLE